MTDMNKQTEALREARQPAPATELREQEPVHVAFASNEAEHPEDRYIKTAHIEVKRYQDGTLAVGPTPLPDMSPVQQEPVAWPAGLIERIKAAEQRIQDGHAPRRIPADPTDVDLVLAEVRYLLEGKQPPFWLHTSPQAQRTWVGLSDEEIYMNCPNWLSQDQCKVWIQQVEAKLKEKNT